MSAPNLRFGRFEIQPRERRLLVDGSPAVLGARAFDLLLAMATRPGQLVTKQELLDEVWPGSVVEEANLTVHVSALRKVLGGDLIATIPGRGYRFTGTLAPDGTALAPAATPSATSTSVPATSPAPQGRVLIGRDAELDRLEAALRQPGLVTLTGPAGVGKTALARAQAARTGQGAVWVDLAPLTEGGQALAALARALAIPLPEGDPWPALRRALAGRLLVFDNAEHLASAVATLVTELLDAAREQPVLTTSQQPLRVDGEREHRIGPLALPLDDDALDLDRGAVALFVERARAADHRFAGSLEQLPLLREICRRLDGIPLAIEMAAARVPVLGLAGLRDALEERFALLSVGRRDAATRHRTLEAALDWSHGLLAPGEQRLFRACSVFSGGFTLESLVQVAADAAGAAGADEADAQESRWAVIDTLSHLVDISLVTTDAGDPPRFGLLETMRDYGRKRMVASGEETPLRARHAHTMAGLAQRARTGDEVPRALMLAEHDNLREAIAWLLANEPARGVEMAIDVASPASFSTWRLEALRWLDSCEAVVEGGALPPLLRARWWLQRAAQWVMNRDPRARAIGKHALELYQGLGDDMGEFLTLSCIVRASAEPHDDLEEVCAAMRARIARHPEWPLWYSTSLAGAEAWVCGLRADYEGQLRHRLAEREFAIRDGYQNMADAADTNIVTVLNRLGRHDEALAHSQAILERMAGSESGNAAYAWNGRMSALLALGRHDDYRAAARRAAGLLRKIGVPSIAVQYAVLLAAEGRADDAARMIGHARSVFEARGRAMDRDLREDLERTEHIARRTLDEATFDRRVTEGRLFDDAMADEVALRQT